MPNPTISIVTTVYDAKDYIPARRAAFWPRALRTLSCCWWRMAAPTAAASCVMSLAKTDPRIRVFHKENGGPASALNVGLDNARGDYIGFVDSDDLVDPDFYETLLNAIRENDVRIASCNADAVDEQEKPVPGAGVNINIAGRHMAMELLLDTFKTGGFYGLLCWNKLFDIRLFRDKGVHFDETMFFGDDASELHRVYDGEYVYCVPRVLYHYRRRGGQMTEVLFPPRRGHSPTFCWPMRPCCSIKWYIMPAAARRPSWVLDFLYVLISMNISLACSTDPCTAVDGSRIVLLFLPQNCIFRPCGMKIHHGRCAASGVLWPAQHPAQSLRNAAWRLLLNLTGFVELLFGIA